MTYIVIYNPLSRNGKSQRVVNRFVKKMSKSHEIKSISVFDIEDTKAFIDEVSLDAKVVFIGGDGTIHHLANHVDMDLIQQEVYLLQAGTGNDFARSIRKERPLILLNKHLSSLPTATLDQSNPIKFINGVGVGLDGLVCSYIDITKNKKSKFNYFKQAIKAFFKYQPSHLTFCVDGKHFQRKKVWLASVMWAPYLGGGMKIAPKQKRGGQELSLVIVERVPRWLLILIFPTIYLGLHRLFFWWVKTYKGTNIIIETDKGVPLQMDGEARYLKDKLLVATPKPKGDV